LRESSLNQRENHADQQIHAAKRKAQPMTTEHPIAAGMRADDWRIGYHRSTGQGLDHERTDKRDRFKLSEDVTRPGCVHELNILSGRLTRPPVLIVRSSVPYGLLVGKT
jgi:hypothetical protein